MLVRKLQGAKSIGLNYLCYSEWVAHVLLLVSENEEFLD